MIEATNLSKSFGNIKAVDSINATIKPHSVFGLIGTNGAGKSTFLRMAAGVLKPDTGTIKLDGIDIFENIHLKERFFYISDDQYFLPNSTPEDMKNYYKMIYKNFDNERFYTLLKSFDLGATRKIKTFSKGMKKQVSIILALCAKTDYIFCDETFDGLDPVMRQAVKSLFAQDMEDRGLTPIIASHNLRELEDICEHVGLLHKGGILLSRDLDEMKLGIHKAQCVFRDELPDDAFTGIDILKIEKRGSMRTITARGDKHIIENAITRNLPIFYEMLPLTLEEIFISETEVAGYDIKSLLL